MTKADSNGGFRRQIFIYIMYNYYTRIYNTFWWNFHRGRRSANVLVWYYRIHMQELAGVTPFLPFSPGRIHPSSALFRHITQRVSYGLYATFVTNDSYDQRIQKPKNDSKKALYFLAFHSFKIHTSLPHLTGPDKREDFP
jgi:hypothetical protein